MMKIHLDGKRIGVRKFLPLIGADLQDWIRGLPDSIQATRTPAGIAIWSPRCATAAIGTDGGAIWYHAESLEEAAERGVRLASGGASEKDIAAFILEGGDWESETAGR